MTAAPCTVPYRVIEPTRHRWTASAPQAGRMNARHAGGLDSPAADTGF